MRIIHVIFLVLPLVHGGCQEMRVTDPPRTATEQFLLATSARRAADRVAAEALDGKRVYVDDRYFGPDRNRLPERQYMLGELRASLLESGARLVPRRGDAEVIVSAFSGGLGIDRYDFLLGIPLGPIFAAAGASAETVEKAPDIGLKDRREYGTAGVHFVAYWAGTGELIAHSGPNYGRSFKQKYGFLEGLNEGDSNIPTTRTAEELEQQRVRQQEREEREREEGQREQETAAEDSATQ